MNIINDPFYNYDRINQLYDGIKEFFNYEKIIK